MQNLSLKEKAYRIIKQRIINATYPANSFIDEKELSKEFNASRTPVREAIIALSQEGYLQILPKRGIMVVPFTYQDAVDVFEVRMLLEPWLVKTYGPLLTRDELLRERELIIKENEGIKNLQNKPGISMKHHPHVLLIEKCTNRNIQNMLEFAEQQVERIPDVRRVPGNYDLTGLDTVLEDHLRLVDLMLEGNFEDAAKDMEWHVAKGQEEYMNFWFN